LVEELAHEDGRRFVWFINMLGIALRCEPRSRTGALRTLAGSDQEPVFDGTGLDLPPFAVRVLELKERG